MDVRGLLARALADASETNERKIATRLRRKRRGSSDGGCLVQSKRVTWDLATVRKWVGAHDFPSNSSSDAYDMYGTAMVCGKSERVCGYWPFPSTAVSYTGVTLVRLPATKKGSKGLLHVKTIGAVVLDPLTTASAWRALVRAHTSMTHSTAKTDSYVLAAQPAIERALALGGGDVLAMAAAGGAILVDGVARFDMRFRPAFAARMMVLRKMTKNAPRKNLALASEAHIWADRELRPLYHAVTVHAAMLPADTGRKLVRLRAEREANGQSGAGAMLPLDEDANKSKLRRDDVLAVRRLASQVYWLAPGGR